METGPSSSILPSSQECHSSDKNGGGSVSTVHGLRSSWSRPRTHASSRLFTITHPGVVLVRYRAFQTKQLISKILRTRTGCKVLDKRGLLSRTRTQVTLTDRDAGQHRHQTILKPSSPNIHHEDISGVWGLLALLTALEALPTTTIYDGASKHRPPNLLATLEMITVVNTNLRHTIAYTRSRSSC